MRRQDAGATGQDARFRGVIRVLDFAAMTKGEDGEVAALEISELADGDQQLRVFEGASSGLLGDEDLVAAAEALEPGTSAAVLLYENTWAAPLAAAVRRSGGQLVANGRIPIQQLLAALDALEGSEAATA